jgi:hypothetical protein
MSKLVLELDLPAPSRSLLDAVAQHVANTVLSPDHKRWLDEFHGNTINSSLHNYHGNDTLKTLAQQQYQTFFPKHRVDAFVGIMKNIQHSPACMPPHVDSYRAMAINYLIEPGGDNVQTVFYNAVRPIKTESHNLCYPEVSQIESHVFKQAWYAFSVNRCHSVENLQTQRIFLALRLIKSQLDLDWDLEYSVNDFNQDYPELIK